MWIDKSLTFGEGMSLAVVAGETGVLIGDVIDAAGANLDGLAILGGVTAKAIAFIRTLIGQAAADGTWELQLRASSLAALTGGTTKILWSSGVQAEAIGAANYKVMDVQLPPMPDGTRYLGLWIIARTQDIATGTLDGYIATETPQYTETHV